jgi:hypothetical protein
MSVEGDLAFFDKSRRILIVIRQHPIRWIGAATSKDTASRKCLFLLGPSSTTMDFIRTQDKSGKPLVIRRISTFEDALGEINRLRAQVAMQARTIRELRLEIEELDSRYGASVAAE